MTIVQSPVRAKPLSAKIPVYGVLVAGGFSALGNAIAGVALPWFVLDLTGSAAWTSVAAAFGMVPLVLGALFGGMLIEKIGARRMALIGDFISALSVMLIAVLHGFGMLPLGLLLALIAIGALLDGPATTAQESRYPELTRFAGLKLERVTALDELIDNFALIGGPIIAGLTIAAAGPTAALIVTAGCSAISVLINAAILPRDRPIRSHPSATKPSDMWTGLRFLFGDGVLRALLLLGMGVVAIFGALDAVVIPVMIKQQGRNVAELGWFLAAAGSGAILSALSFAAFGGAINKRWLLLVCLVCEALAMLVLVYDPRGAMLLVAGAVAGLGAGPLGPMINTVLLKSAPMAIRSRVLGASTAIALTATPLAVLVAGAVIEAFGTRPLLISAAVVFSGLTLVAAALPSLRRLR